MKSLYKSIINVILNEFSINSTFYCSRKVSSVIFVQSLKGQYVARYATEANSKESIPAPEKGAVNPRVANLVDQIATLTLIETSELIQLLKVSFDLI